MVVCGFVQNIVQRDFSGRYYLPLANTGHVFFVYNTLTERHAGRSLPKYVTFVCRGSASLA